MIRVLAFIGLVLCVLGGYFFTPFLLGAILVWFFVIKYEFFFLGILLDIMMRDTDANFVFPVYSVLTLIIIFGIPIIQGYVFSSDKTMTLR
jgi:hypothetical protein